MNEDELILLFSFIGYWTVLTFRTYKSDTKLKTGLINLFIHIAYSSYFLYGLFYTSQEGSALAWFLYLVCIIWIHTAINLGQYLYTFYQDRS